MPETMKAAIYKEGSNRLSVEEYPVPEISNNELLVQVIACGACHTDLHYLDHGVSTFKKPPLILGHEASGIVVKSLSKKFKTGDRVLIPSTFSCGKCDFCNSNRNNICRNMIMPGNHIDGAFAQYIKVPDSEIILLPDEIPLEEACIIADALSTPYHAVFNRAKVLPNNRVLVIGCGGVGINVVKFSALAGAEVIACDINEDKLRIAADMGAKYTVNTDNTPLKDFLNNSGDYVDIAFEVIGKPETIEAAFKSLKPAGKLCIIGYTNKNININPAKIMFYEQEIIGSIGCPASEYPKIIEFVLQGKIKLSSLINNKYPLELINKAFDELRESKVLRNIILPNGRFVK